MSRCSASIFLLGMCFSSGFSCPLLHVLPADVPASCPNRLTLAIAEGCIFPTILLAMVGREHCNWRVFTDLLCLWAVPGQRWLALWNDMQFYAAFEVHVVEIVFLNSSSFSCICWGTAILCSWKRLIHCMLGNELLGFLPTEKYYWNESPTCGMGLLHSCLLGAVSV